MTSRGFTLVEVLVSIAIIALLGALAMPLLNSAQTRANITQSTSNLRVLAAANLAYAADHGTYCPGGNRYETIRWHGARTSYSSAFDPSEGLLAPYLGYSQAVSPCPLMRDLLGDTGTFEEGTGGYGYNTTYVGGRPVPTSDRYSGSPDWMLIPSRPANIEAPSLTVMFTTSAYARTGGVQEYPFSEPPFWDQGNGLNGRPSPSVHFRAAGKALVAWCDGHVSAEAMEERPVGTNPHGGNAEEELLGWFGPDENNGYWNSTK